MKRILIYFPYNQRSVEQQSVMEMLVNKGHKVHLLTLAPEGPLHELVRVLGVTASASAYREGFNPVRLAGNARVLAAYCNKHKIDLIFAHQQLCAMPLILAGPFIRTRNFYIRHNTDEDYLTAPLKARLLNRFINSRSSHIIAPSEAVYQYLTEKEKVPAKKIQRINYGYNFNLYAKPVQEKVISIRNQHPCQLLLISIARLTPPKRHELMFRAVQELVNEGLDIRMICLGNGQLRESLSVLIKKEGLEQSITLEGNQPNVMDYLSAADLLLHLSETEASNSVVKEAALAGLPAIVCKNVGDFDDYITNEANGFLVDKKDPVVETVSIIRKLYQNMERLKTIGTAAHDTVLKTFSITNVAGKYEDLLK